MLSKLLKFKISDLHNITEVFFFGLTFVDVRLKCFSGCSGLVWRAQRTLKFNL